ncbi:Hypothetical predicted protein [Paramuricea clavata]|uniref:Uncharacterized protein n=1 Tax=Paramuricea clavata TaxID=317549 RepID=A0A7D9ITB0_PARCT|nr:Hypothetical predicted protein [Paramuricea clavata]
MSGFRKGHSTAVTLLKLNDDILKAMKKGEITLAVFTYYSKAFDTVDFRILLKTLYDLGFPTDFLLWIHSYLDGRKQFVQIDDRKSGLLTYADDTSLYQHTKVKNLSKCVDDMQKELDRANSWSKNSNLLMNPTKTKTMVFSTSQMSTTHNLASLDLVSMHINHQNIERTKSWKVLEVKEVTRVLRSNSDGTLRLKHSYIEDTFQYNAAKVFNDIPDNFKCMDFKNFKISLKKLLLDRSKERLNLD